MGEKIISGKKNGMLVLILTILLLIAGVVLIILGIAINPLLLVLGILIECLGWIPFLGLKVIKPQEALVLTLFGKYYGTLKGEGFYAVNPFCVSVNPAAKTELNQKQNDNAESLADRYEKAGSTAEVDDALAKMKEELGL